MFYDFFFNIDSSALVIGVSKVTFIISNVYQIDRIKYIFVENYSYEQVF